MVRYKCTIAYDGTDFAGWQIQPQKKTVSSILQTTFKRVFKESIKIIGASRTDAGVHALGQITSFTTQLSISPEKMRWAWNRSLPDSISILSLEKVSDDFRPRNNVLQKTYFYDVYTKRPLPFKARYGYYYPYKLDEQKLKNALAIFVGKHDFTSFSSDQRTNKVRTIDAIKLYPLSDGEGYRIEIKGKSFLHCMIRRIVGACLKVAGDEKLSIDLLKKALAKKNPNQALPNAPAKGLLLYKIDYIQ
jgi:tRNA pseudouridine38-40 synthase